MSYANLLHMWQHHHQQFTVHQLPALSDNYIYLIQADNSDQLIAIDPPEAASINRYCSEHHLSLSHILNTHHHWDHTDGNKPLKQRHDCIVVGAASDAARIPEIEMLVDGTTGLTLNGLPITTLEVPGHTIGHLAYLIDDALFCGDLIFGAGCGRLFEGTPKQMWQSLCSIANLDPSTQIYCAHEYTETNLRFAMSIRPELLALQQRIDNSAKARAANLPTVPSTLALELSTNPFFWPLDSDFCATYAAEYECDSEPLAVFTHLRERRNHF